MKVEVIRNGEDWLLLDGSGKVIATAYVDHGTYRIPDEIVDAMAKALLTKEELEVYDELNS